ncbi:sugar transferase [Streptomyces sp. 8N616]|uniref:sugar transferase n=1 Tax=Streptomyces sp. 8N616 TaxID=3457414 RepID=UPI003FD47963
MRSELNWEYAWRRTAAPDAPMWKRGEAVDVERGDGPTWPRVQAGRRRLRDVLGNLVSWRGVRSRCTDVGSSAGRSCAIVLGGGVWPDSDDDRLDEELTVVARLPAPANFVQLDVLMTVYRPRALFLKSSLEYLDGRLMNLCLAHSVDLLLLARPAYGLLGSMRLQRVGGLPWLRLRWRVRRPAHSFSKRAMDLLLIALTAPISIPVMLLISAVLCWDGPPLFFQERVGEGGRIFRLVKFRTMKVNAEYETGPVLARTDDPRVTTLGRALRRIRLDELPQLWNVLRGDMSLVGPRPERPEFIAEFRRLPHYDLRHLIRPGITGIAQLTDGYTASVKEKLRCDLLYVNSRSVRLDLRLLLLTLGDLVRGFPRG